MISKVTAHTPILHSIQCHLLLGGQYGLLSRRADWPLSLSITVRFPSLTTLLMHLPSQQEATMTSTSTPPLFTFLSFLPCSICRTSFRQRAYNATGSADFLATRYLQTSLSLHLCLAFILWHAWQNSWFSDPLASWLLSPFSFHVCLLSPKLFRLYCSVCLFNIRRRILLEAAFQWTRESSS